jgi:hypothetical protein
MYSHSYLELALLLALVTVGVRAAFTTRLGRTQ